MQRATRRRGWALAVVAGLSLTACAETETSTTSVGATEPVTTEAPVTTDASGGTEPAAGPSAPVQWALDYVGGTAAAASGDPVRIGFASTSDLFPDADTAADATATYVNEQLGGIDGRPLEIVHCNLSVPEDGTACATQFANDDSIVLAVVGQALVGAGDFYKTISGKKPVYTAAPSGLDDFISTVSVSYFAGALGASLGIAGFVLEEIKPATLGVLITDDAAGRGGFAVLEPILKSAGADVRPVFVAPTATAPEVESALQAVSVNDLDALVVGVFEPGCIATYDALKNLGVDPLATAIIAVSPCHGAAMQQHMADVGESGILPNGWYFTGSGYNLFTGNAESGTDTVLDIFASVGKPELAYSVGTEEVIGGLMTLVKHLNGLDGDFAVASIDQAIRSYEGPVMSAAGPMACGAPPLFKGICTTRASIERYIDGGWEATRAGDDSIDITPYTTPAG